MVVKVVVVLVVTMDIDVDASVALAADVGVDVEMDVVFPGHGPQVSPFWLLCFYFQPCSCTARPHPISVQHSSSGSGISGSCGYWRFLVAVASAGGVCCFSWCSCCYSWAPSVAGPKYGGWCRFDYFGCRWRLLRLMTVVAELSATNFYFETRFGKLMQNL